MFRQKIIQMTDCSCRLIPQGKEDYKIFKMQDNLPKPKSKQIKQKFSLKAKGQTASSQKQESGKINSANKGPQKYQKNSQASKVNHLTTHKNADEKISISGNLDSKKKKNNQKMSVCSPSQSNIRKNNENKHITSHQTQQNFSRTVQAQRNLNQKLKKVVRNSHQQFPLQIYMAKQQKVSVSNFMNQNSNQYLSQPSEMLKFQDYYKLISNPYPIKSKQNSNININIKSTRYEKVYKDNQYRQNQMKKVQKQKQLHNHNQKEHQQNSQLIHESLEKYNNNKNKARESRGTFNQYNQGYMINLQNQFATKKPSQVLNPSISHYSSQNFNYFPFPLGDSHNNVSGANIHQQNHKINATNVRRNSGQLFSVKNQFMNNKSQLHKIDQQRSIVAELKRKQNNSQNYNKIIKVTQNKLYKKSTICTQISVKDSSSSEEQQLNFHQTYSSKDNIEKLQIQKINTFKEIMGLKEQCESLLDQSIEADQSIVVMRYNDFLEKTDSGRVEGAESSILKPLNLDLIGNSQPHQHIKNKISSLTVSTKPSVKYDTNVKKTKDTGYLNEDDYLRGCINNLKKTVKMPKGYTTNH